MSISRRPRDDKGGSHAKACIRQGKRRGVGKSQNRSWRISSAPRRRNRGGSISGDVRRDGLSFKMTMAIKKKTHVERGDPCHEREGGKSSEGEVETRRVTPNQSITGEIGHYLLRSRIISPAA